MNLTRPFFEFMFGFTTAKVAIFKPVGIAVVIMGVALGGCQPTSSPDPSSQSDQSASTDSLTDPDATPDEWAEGPENPSEGQEQSTDSTTDVDSASVDGSDSKVEESSDIIMFEDHVESIVRQYYGLLQQGQYEQAWGMLSDEMQAQESYDTYVERWDSLERINLEVISNLYASEVGGTSFVLLSSDAQDGTTTEELVVVDIFGSEAAADGSNDWRISRMDEGIFVEPTQPQSPSPLTTATPVAIDGIGPIRVGMTLQEAADATGLPMASTGVEVTEGCGHYQALGGPDSLSFMVTNDRISRVEIYNPDLKTISGAGIGSSIDEIQALYPGKIEVTPHKYDFDGKYVTFVPQDPADQRYRIIFETDKTERVVRFRSGQDPEVFYVEGCA